MIIDACFYIAEVIQCYEQLSVGIVGKELMKEAVLSWTLIHKQVGGGIVKVWKHWDGAI